MFVLVVVGFHYGYVCYTCVSLFCATVCVFGFDGLWMDYDVVCLS